MHWLHTYAPDTPLARTRATWAALAALADWWTAQGHTLTVVRCATPTTYERAVRHWWGRADLLLTEHDVVPTLAALADLLTCPAPVCAVAYPLHWPSTVWARVAAALAALAADPAQAARWTALCAAHPTLAAGLALGADAARAGTPIPGGVAVWAHRVATGDPTAPERWIRPGETWADYAAFGCTRIRATGATLGPPTWAPGTWLDLDTRVSDWWHAHGQRIHIHWPPVAHHHPLPADKPASPR